MAAVESQSVAEVLSVPPAERSESESAKAAPRNRRRIVIEALLRARILSVEGVERITRFELDLDRRERTLAVRWEADTPLGTARGWFEA